MIKNTIVYSLCSFSRRFLPGRLYPLRDKLFALLNVRLKNVVISIGDIFMSIDTNNYHEREMLTFGTFEIGTTRFLRKYISSLTNCVIIDVGANIGIHTLTMSQSRQLGSAVSVLAIEPNPDMAYRLKKNLRINNVKDTHVCQCGVSSAAERISLGLPYPENCDVYHNPGIASMVQTERAVRSIEVDCRTIDEIVHDLGYEISKVGLVKLDIEGKELDALYGMNEILGKSDAAIIVEFNNNIFQSVVDYLSGYGYEVVGSLLRYGIDANVRAENVLFMKAT